MKKKILFTLIAIFQLLASYSQSTFGPWVEYSNNPLIINPSSYYSPVTGDPTLPNRPGSGCTNYNNGNVNVTVTNGTQMTGNNAVAGYGGYTNFNSSAYKPYTSDVSFRILVPPGYDQNDGKKYPFILFLHGLGEGGQLPGLSGYCDVRWNDNDHQLTWGGQNHLNINNSADLRYKAIIMFPQNNNGNWQDQNNNYQQFQVLTSSITAVRQFISGAATTDGKKFNIDPNRVYLEGLSTGGMGAWSALYNNADLFAGAIIMSAAGSTSPANADLLKYTPIWNWQGAVDNVAISIYNNAIDCYNVMSSVSGFKRDNQTDVTSGGIINGIATNYYIGNKRFLGESNEGHGVFTDAYNHPDYWRWLFAQNKLNIVPFGDTSICIGNKVLVGIQSGYNGYDWQYSVDGSTNSYSSTLPNGLANNTNNINIEEPGFYRVRLNRVSSGWTYYSNPIQIIRRASTAAQVVVQNNSSILPSIAGSSLTLSVPNGFENYLWSTGANTSSINASSAGIYSVSVKTTGLCQGIYSDTVKVLTGQSPLTTLNSPSNLLVSTTSANSINVQWQDNSNNESGFELFRSSGGAYSYVGLVPANSTSYLNTGLASNTNYIYQVRAMIKGVGASGYSNTSSISILIDNSPPSTPNNLAAIGIGTNFITLSWDASTDNVGVIGYDIFVNGTYNSTTSLNSITISSLNEATEYNFTIRAKDAANNFSSFTPSLQVFTYKTVANGINYKYYENSYSNLNQPLFNNNTPVKFGIINNVDISIRDRDINIGFNFYGFIKITTAGTYTFYTASDDGSNLFIGSTKVVMNDYDQGVTERSGTIDLVPGYYPIQITYRQGGGGFGMTASWAGPGIPKALIPNNVLYPDVTTGGLFYAKYTGNLTNLTTWSNTPDGNGSQPVNFVSNSQIFYIINRTVTLDANWNVSGTNSKIVVGNNSIVTFPSSFAYTGTLDIQGNGKVIFSNGNLPAFGSISQNSTITFGSNVTVPAGLNLGNVILSSGTTTLSAGTTNISGNLSILTGTLAGTGSSTLIVKGNTDITNNTSIPVNVLLSGNDQIITGNGKILTISNLTLNPGSKTILSTTGGTTNLVLNGDLTLQTLSTLNINSNTLTTNGSATINSGSQMGVISVNNGSIILNSVSAGNSNLYFDPSFYSISNFTINSTGGGVVNLKNSLKLSGILKLQSGNFNTTNGNFILKSDASGTGRITKVESGASLTGNITQQRFISPITTAKGWFFVSTSIKDQTLNDWTNDANIQGPWIAGKVSNVNLYREDIHASLPTNDPKNYQNVGWYELNNLSDNISPGRGYRIYLYNEFFKSRTATLENTGQPVIGNGLDGINTAGSEAFSFNLSYTPLTGYDGGGWNLIANPFPSDIDWKNTGWTRNNVDNSVYIWNSLANNGKGRYESYVNGVPQGPNGDGKIAAGQAFFVRANGSSPTLTATEDVKTSTSTSFYKTSEINDLLRISLVNEKSETAYSVIYFNKEATSNFDNNFDSHLLNGSINLGSLSKDKKELAINALSDMSDSIPLTLKNNSKGNYTLNFNSIETFKEGVKIYLTDKLNKTITDISTDVNYKFSISGDTNTFASRFVLVFKPTSIVISGNLSNEAGEPLTKANVKINKNLISLDQSSSFSYSGFSYQNYNISITENSGIINSRINVKDIATLRRYLNNKISLSNYKLIAADLDSSSIIDTKDLKYLQNAVLSGKNNFPKHNAWEFIPSDFVFNGSPFPYNNFVTVNSKTDVKLDFIGVQIGKLSNPVSGKSNEKSFKNLDFYFDDYSAIAGSEIIIPIKVKKFNAISGYQFTLKWNPDILNFAGFQNESLQSLIDSNNVSKGQLFVIWDEENGSSKTMNDGSVIFNIKFKVKKTNEKVTSVLINDSNSFALTSDLIQTSINTKVGDIIIHQESGSVKEFSISSSYPNPFTEEANIVYNIPENSNIVINIFNSKGQIIDKILNPSLTGENIYLWNPHKRGISLNTGLYFYSIQFKNKVLTGKMLFIN